MSATSPEGTVMAGSSLSVVGKVPLTAILDAAAAASKNGGVIMAEGFIKQALLAYESGKAAA